MIRASIYDQEGNLLPFVMSDSKDNEMFREWLARHDRYTQHERID